MLQPQITITPAAEMFIRRMVRFSETPTGGFKLSVAPGGCSGYSSEFSVEARPAPGESECAVGGLRLFLNAESRLLLDGMTMDFAETPLQSGLVFSKPGAAACACSTADAGAPQRPAEAAVSLSSIKRR